ncbi:DPP IV N-terminal domain-containing protein [Chloroflexota bacterium]
MKAKHLSLRNSVLWVGILLLAGCSTGINGTPASMPTLTNVPASSPVVTSALLPFAGRIAFVSKSGTGYYYHVYVMNADGSEINDITPPDLLLISSLAWSPSGEYLAFDATIGAKAQIYTIRADGADLKQLTFGEEHSSSPSWSPDGKYILFVSSQKDILDYRGQVARQGYIMKSDGSEVRRLKDDNDSVVDISYRNDGFISVLAPATRKTAYNYIINSNGVIQHQFPRFTLDGIPVWSPDSNLVAYMDTRTDCSGIILMKPDGSNQVCLKIDGIPPSASVGIPSWSPDGQYIIFSSNIDNDGDIYIVKPDGSELTRLTNMPGDETWPVWSAAP